MSDWIIHLVDRLGYPGILFLMFLENVFPPIPSELIMPFAGFDAARGRLTLPGVILAGTLGSVLGQLPLYGLGRWAGAERLERWADRHGRWIGLSAKDIRASTGWFERHGGKAVFLCRLVPGLRSLISIPAGVAGMNLPVFLLFSTFGMGLWTAALAVLGAQLGEHYERVARYLGPVGGIVLGGLLIFWLIRLVRRRRAASSEADS